MIPQRLRAIDRLLEQGRLTPALEKIEAALKVSPRHGGLLRRRVETLLELNRLAEAELIAYQWTQTLPNSPQAWEALYRLALKKQHIALAMDAARHFNQLAERTGERPIAAIDESEIEAGIINAYTGASIPIDELLQMEIGQLYIGARHFQEAYEILKSAKEPPARNNLGLCLFYLGRFQEALDCFKENWDSEPRNLTAVGWMARIYLFLGDEERAQGLAAPLMHTLPVRMEDAMTQIETLLLLGKEEEALEAFDKAREQSWWQAVEGVPTSALVLHMGAVCHARAGNRTRALSLWQQAYDLNPNIPYIVDNLNDLKRPPSERHGAYAIPVNEYLPIPWLRKLGREHPDDAATDGKIPISNAYLEAIARISDRPAMKLGTALLLDRLGHGDKDAGRRLLAILKGKQGSFQERFSLGMALLQAGLIERGKTIDLWDGKKFRPSQLKDHKIHNEPIPNKLSPSQQERMAEALDAFQRGDMITAKKLLERLSHDAPDEPSVWGNLATIHERLGDKEKSRAFIEKSVEIDPDYLIGRCNLALTELQDGNIETAKQYLEGLSEREELHIHEATALFGAQAVLSAIEGNYEQAMQLLDSIAPVAESFGEIARVDMYRSLLQPAFLRGALLKKGGWKGLFREALE